MKKTCAQCGALIEQSSIFCNYCGAIAEYEDAFDCLDNFDQIRKPTKANPLFIVGIIIAISVFIAVCFWLFFFKKSNPSLSLSNEGAVSTELSFESENDDEKADDISAFCEDISGIWLRAGARELGAGIYFISITDDMEMTDVVYEGGYGRTGKMTEIEKNSDGSFKVVLYYPKTKATHMYGEQSELEKIATFDSFDGYSNSLKIIYEDGKNEEYEYVAENIEQAHVVFAQIIAEKNKMQDGSYIPQISAYKEELETDIDVFKIRIGDGLVGPDQALRPYSQSFLYLTNLSDVDCYMNAYEKDQLLGVKNGKTVFFGVFGLNRYSINVKDLLPNNALTVKPAVYSIGDDLYAYLWKMENGYMSIVVMPIGGLEFYDHSVLSVVYVTDLEYLSYIN